VVCAAYDNSFRTSTAARGDAPAESCSQFDVKGGAGVGVALPRVEMWVATSGVVSSGGRGFDAGWGTLVTAGVVPGVDVTRMDVAAISCVERSGWRWGSALASPAHGGAPRRLIASALSLSVPELARPESGSRMELFPNQLTVRWDDCLGPEAAQTGFALRCPRKPDSRCDGVGRFRGEWRARST
jgi:hypothetical protein